MKAPTVAAAALVALAVTGCAGTISGDAGGDDGTDQPCHLNLVFDPQNVVAGPTTMIRVSAVTVDVLGVLAYSWRVTFGGTPVNVTSAQDDGSQIEFLAPDPGTYDVNLNIAGTPGFCTAASTSINVRARGAQNGMLRLRVVPPPTVAAPPLEKSVTVYGGGDANLGIVGLDRGTLVHPLVSGPDGGVPAYLRFAPLSAVDAVVEAFSDASGHVDVQLLPQPHAVFVVPADAGSAPRRIASWSPASTMIGVDAGSSITGTVHDPADAPLAGAKVQLSIDGVPSTLATTASDGSFALRAVTAGAGAVTVEVTPPNASGLPRLSATSQTFNLSTALQIRYASGLARKDLVGTQVQRQGAPVANAAVMVVGSLPAAGTVTAGTSASAAGNIRVSSSTNAMGKLPGMLVPTGANLSAVITVAAGDLAVAVLDLGDPLPTILDAPAMQPVTTAVQGPPDVDLRGAIVDFVPSGALAMAGAPALHVTAGTSGVFTAMLADGGHYDLRFHDPAGRAAPLVVANRVAGSVAPAYRLPAALLVQGSLIVGGTQVLPNASVQMLCDACTGIERAKPIAETVSDENGQFTLAVPDLGTMP
jgi:Carboxypeptidase regulatory-like domain